MLLPEYLRALLSHWITLLSGIASVILATISASRKTGLSYARHVHDSPEPQSLA